MSSSFSAGVYRREISRSCWYFRPSFVNCCPLTFSLVQLSPPSSTLCEMYTWYTYTVCKGVGEGLWGSWTQKDTHLPVSPFLDDTFCIAFYECYLSTGEAIRGRLRSICTGRCTDTEIVMCTAGYNIYLWTYDLYGPIRNSFDVGKSNTRASGRRLGPGNWDFCEMASSRHASGGWAQKRFPGPNPLPLALVMDWPASKALCKHCTGPSDVHR
jgi:hypothetical protein